MSGNPDFVIENGILEKYKGPGGDVTIPAGVMVIGLGSFKGCTGLTSVTIPESVTIIESCAFEECTSLTNVTIPQSVIEIGVRAFSDTPWLKNLGDFAVANHILLEYQGKSKGVVIPADITVIKCGAFQNYTGLISVTIPESVTKIERSAFEGCTSLTSVVILEGVNLIGGRAFCGCTSLNSITIPASVTEIGWSAFEGCTSLTSVAIPESVTEIGESAFASCSPALLAPHTPIANFAVENKPGACCGFAKLYLEHTEMDLAIQAGYLKYIRNQKKRLYTVAVHHEELLRLMIAEEMLVRKDIDLLLEECDKQNNIVARAAVLDYADENLKPVDSLGDVEKEAKTIEHRTKQIERTGQLPAKELKRIWSTQKREDSTLEITSYKGLRPMSLSPP